MSKVWSNIKYWSQLFYLPLYWLSHCIPRDKKLWAFGSTFGTRFADNPKYMYLYLNRLDNKEVRAVWITKNKEVSTMLRQKRLPAFYLYSVRGIWYSLRATVYIYDNYSKDICFLLSGGAMKVNLWHGIPLKKINQDNIYDHVRNPRSGMESFRWALRRLQDEKPYHYVLTTSEFLRPIFASAFKTNKVLINGYPRNDLLEGFCEEVLLTDDEESLFRVIKETKNIRTKLLYMPTFRNSETRFFDIMDLDRFQQFLLENQMLFCVKLHPKSRVWQRFAECRYKNVVLIPPEADPYPFLELTDILITDYSSIYFDFLLKDKPIIFFDYDRKEYLEHSREMYFSYEEYTPGWKASTMIELEAALLKEDTYQNSRKRVREKVFDKTNVCASEELYNIIKKELLTDHVRKSI